MEFFKLRTICIYISPGKICKECRDYFKASHSRKAPRKNRMPASIRLKVNSRSKMKNAPGNEQDAHAHGAHDRM